MKTNTMNYNTSAELAVADLEMVSGGDIFDAANEVGNCAANVLDEAKNVAKEIWDYFWDLF